MMKTLYETKKLKYSFTIAMIFWLLVNTFAANPVDNAKDFVKTIEKEFNITANGTVHIENKYGEINVNTWGKNEVLIKVEITVDSKNEEKAQDIFDKINIKFENDDDFVKAVTEIKSGSKSSSWFNWGGSKNEKYKINYSVNMPASAELELHNKYGNVAIDLLNNDCRLHVKYGNIAADRIDGNVDLQLGYGKGEISFARNISGAIKYSKLNVGEIKDFEMASKYSEIHIDKCDLVKVQSKYDNYTIDKISDIDINTKYTEIDIEELANSATLNIAYGGVKIKDLKANFSHITGEAKYTGFNISPSDGASYTFDLNTKYGSIKVPAESEVNYDKSGDKTVSKKGKVGSASASGNISITSKHGNITINR